ncbi:hypothetical protein D3C72_2319450 [compost metagenome]
MPAERTAAVTTGGSTGHVAWVEQVYTKNGETWVKVSQYNYQYPYNPGVYSEMDVRATYFDSYIYF